MRILDVDPAEETVEDIRGSDGDGEFLLVDVRDRDAVAQALRRPGWSPDALSKERAARWADPKGGYIHAMHRAIPWRGSWIRVRAKRTHHYPHFSNRRRWPGPVPSA